jgi:hypothetical protein
MTEQDHEPEQDDESRDCWILQRKTLDTRPREAGVYLNKGEAIQTAEEIKAESHDRTLVFITKSELHS